MKLVAWLGGPEVDEDMSFTGWAILFRSRYQLEIVQDLTLREKIDFRSILPLEVDE